MTEMIGITERGDASLDHSWTPWIEAGNAAILITKNPEGLKDYFLSKTLPMDRVIIHCTITSLSGSRYEPNVPKTEDSLKAYSWWVDRIGGERTVLRIDPIIPIEGFIERAQEVACRELGRVRVSFLDNYNHVKRRFMSHGMCPLPYEFHADHIAREWCLKKLIETVGHDIEICCEGGMAGIQSKGCVSVFDANLLRVKPFETQFKQRSHCGCLGNKLELLTKETGPCAFKCVYCYRK